MTYSSGSSEIFDLFIDLLNQNTQNVEFSGNFTFRFWSQTQAEQEFHIVRKDPDKLDYDVDKVVPVVNVQTIEIPFVERNGRSDYEIENYIAIKVDQTIDPDTNQMIIEFDENTPEYQALLETIDTIRSNLTFPNGSGRKFSIKAKDPQKVNTFKFTGNYYTIFAVTLTLTAIDDGLFGNEIAMSLAEAGQGFTDANRLDVVEADFIVGKGTYQFSPRDQDQTQRTRVNNRTNSYQVTVNYVPNTAGGLLWDEIHGAVVNKVYQLRSAIGANVLQTRNVVITSINTSIRNNAVVRITFSADEV